VLAKARKDPASQLSRPLPRLLDRGDLTGSMNKVMRFLAIEIQDCLCVKNVGVYRLAGEVARSS
jgi:hypothetical protein